MEPNERTESELQDYDAFDAAFDEATGDAPGATDEKPQTKPEENPLDQEPEEESAQETESEPEEEPDYKELLEKERQKTSTWNGRISAAERRAKEAEERLQEFLAQQQAPKQETPFNNDTSEPDNEALKEFVEEFPEFEEPINAMIERKTKALLQSELQKITPDLSMIKNQVAQSATEAHYSAIKKAHPDWAETVQSGKLDTWIDEQPMITRNAFKSVVHGGSTDEVIQLLDIYKQATTNTQKQTQRQKAKKILAVKSGPATQAGNSLQVDMDDFDSAWDEFD